MSRVPVGLALIISTAIVCFTCSQFHVQAITMVPIGLALVICTIIICYTINQRDIREKTITPEMKQDIAFIKELGPELLKLVRDKPPLFGKTFYSVVVAANHNDVADAFLEAGAEPTSKEKADYIITQSINQAKSLLVDVSTQESAIKCIKLNGDPDTLRCEIRALIKSLGDQNRARKIFSSEPVKP